MLNNRISVKISASCNSFEDVERFILEARKQGFDRPYGSVDLFALKYIRFINEETNEPDKIK